ncbi:MAG: MBL fold metallo-hydrolase [Steroidobacteraceae bacterium]
MTTTFATRIRLLLLAGFTCLVAAAQAAAPQVKGQAPGWYRMMLGDFEITALSDGVFNVRPEQVLTNTTADRVAAALGAVWQTSPLDLSVNAFLVNTGTKLVMIDAGAGSLFGPSLGRVVENLRASGYAPEQVDEIYMTHLHGDHVGGLVAEGRAVFPNAIVRGDRHDADHWLSPALAAAAPEQARPAFLGAQQSLGPYIGSGRYKPFDGDTELVPGIRGIAARGHTPGHAVYVVESRGQKMVFWGDLMHIAPVQFPEPAVTIVFDTDPAQAASQRRKTFAEAAAQGYYLAAAHVSFPGIGQLVPDGQGYRWLPVSYSPNR